ncbi:MAG TPA: hypothetical protein VHX38_01315 [Pseudonocardiaceae bacterium]|nr:hypothetical protein [Pseudonocardiaceae bacterium]
MDPRDRADAALARARARGAFVVTPDDAVSPMDATNTQQIPRAVVDSLDTNRQDGDTTMVIANGLARGQGQQQAQQPQQQPQAQQQAAQQLPVQQQYPGQHNQVPQQQQEPISPALLESTPTQPVQQQVQVPVQQQQNYRPAPEPEQPPAPRELDGLVPTVQQPANPRSTLSRRLEGD